MKRLVGTLIYKARLNDGGSALSWWLYDSLVRREGSLRDYATGSLRDDIVEQWKATCRPELATSYSVDTDCPGYIVNRSQEVAERVGKHFSWFAALDQNLIASTIADLRKPIEQQLGGPWRVVNFKVARSVTQAPDVEMFAWHTDGFPENFLKILVYISGATEESGGTELRLADGTVTLCGPPGTWALFNNNTTIHRGRPVTAGERLLLEITITRAFRHGIAYGTVNSSYPRYPWD